ncbi:hypothetical protein FACS1894193_13050 [Bacilli bacterium]|nr:hypothetical protein FACS1894192_02900 [Bacilli bacterium]GHU44522.1 hypothetical protein FACS1894193_13050 [Bacilli bacterium]GHU45215.1 hypothetical protein FACS1894194_0440 [Bacilli bacterium]
MKIYIIGAVASGKTTLAKTLSGKLEMPYYSLDEVVHLSDAQSSIGNTRRTIAEQEQLFSHILKQDNYIIEDVGRPQFIEGLHRADCILFLDFPVFQRYKRVIFRWLKQKIGLEKANYQPTLSMLLKMLKWANTSPETLIQPFLSKTITLRNQTDIQNYIKIVKIK